MRQPSRSDTSSPGSFQNFVDALKRSGKKSGYYPGDSHYGPGYYSDTGQYLGAEDPERAAVNAGVNSGLNQFGPPPSLNNFGPPPSLSNFDNRSRTPPAVSPTYAGMLPTLPPQGAPDWARNDPPKTWTDEFGRVFLVEPLPSEYQNLTPEQLGIRRDEYYRDRETYGGSLEEDFRDILERFSRDGRLMSEGYDAAWKEKGVDFSKPSVGGAAADDIEQLWESLQPEEGSFGSIYREVREREAAEEEAILNRGYLNTTEGYLFYKSFAEAEAERIQKQAASFGITVPDREDALRQGWQTIGGTYINEERMREWNATADKYGITNPRVRYLLDEPGGADAATTEKPDDQLK